jgi:predicted DNA-binding ribbon-helix-helix protein
VACRWSPHAAEHDRQAIGPHRRACDQHFPEAAFWRALCDIAAARQMSVNALIAAIDATRSGNLSSAIRLFVLDSAQKGELRGAEASVSLPPSA